MMKPAMKKRRTTRKPRLFNRLKAGLKEGIRHAKGERALKVTHLPPPNPPGRILPPDRPT